MAPSTPTATDSDHGPPHGSRSWPIVACLIAAGLFVLAVALLYAGWGGKEEASGLIIVQGDTTVDEALVSLYRPTDRGREKYLEAKINSSEDRRLRFHVPPGNYQVVVDFNGHSVLHQDVIATDGGNVPLINISAPGTRPSSP